MAGAIKSLLLFALLLAHPIQSSHAQGEIFLYNRQLRSAGGEAYDVPIWLDLNNSGSFNQNEGIGSYAASIGKTATLALYLQNGTFIGSARFATGGSAGGFVPAPSAALIVPEYVEFARAPLTLKAWIGPSYETATFRGSWNFLSDPLGGNFRNPPNLDGWGPADGLGYNLFPSPYGSIRTLTAAEYFWDTDPGISNGIAIPVEAVELARISFNADISGLAAGAHKLGFRTCNASNVWSEVIWSPIIVQDENSSASPQESLVDEKFRLLTAAEYFWDVEPSPGFGAAVTFSPTVVLELGQAGNLPLNPSISSLGVGSHRFGMRVQNVLGTWSDAHWLPISVYDSDSTTPGGLPMPGNETMRELVAAEYFWDTDPGAGNATAAAISPGQALRFGPPGTNELTIDFSAQTGGPHSLGFRVKDASGEWSAAEVAPLMVPGAPMARFNGLAYPNNIVVTNDGASLQVSLETRYPNGLIYYSVNGGDPVQQGDEYNAPFTIAAPFILRAKAFTADFVLADEMDWIVSVDDATKGGGTLSLVSTTVAEETGITAAQFRAAPAPGWTFVNWAADGSGTATNITLILNSFKKLEAVFGTSLTISNYAIGAISGSTSPHFYPYGSIVRLSAIPSPGYYFRFWSGAASPRVVSPIDFVVTNANPLIGAAFAALSQSTFALNTLVEGQGSVIKTPQQQNYTSNSIVTLTAIPAAGHHFLWWTGEVSSVINPLPLTMTRSKTVLAVFEADSTVNKLPLTSIISPTNNSAFATPVNLTIVTDTTDPDGYIVQTIFLTNGTQLGMTTTLPHSLGWNNAPIGEYILQTIAMDNSGGMATSAPVNIKIAPAPTTYRWEKAATNVNENARYVDLVIVKTGLAAGTVNVATAAISAEAGKDYEHKQIPVDFGTGETNKTIRIILLNEYVPDGDKSFEVRLSPAIAGQLASPSTCVVTTTDDDASLEHNSFLEYRFAGDRPGSRGRLQVYTEPTAAQGQWRFPWDLFWRNNGEIASDLDPGEYPVAFRGRANYESPVLATNSVPGGFTVIVTNNYQFNSALAGGSLTVLFSPLNTVDPALVGWRLLGDTAYHTNNEKVIDIAPGIHVIEFRPVANWLRPQSREVLIQANVDSILNVSYTLELSKPIGVALPTPLTSYAVIHSGQTSPPRQPYPLTGQLRSSAGYGSGVAVREHVVLTAAHVLFDDNTLDFVTSVDWFGELHAGEYQPKPMAARGWYVHTNYLTERRRERTEGGLAPGVSGPASQQWDFAAVFFEQPVARGGFSGYLLSDLDLNQWLISGESKELIGYPLNGLDDGKMHWVIPSNYTFARDAGRVFLTTGFLSYPGNSGGPICVQIRRSDDDLIYFPAAIYLGNKNNGALARAIDSDVASVINRAESSAILGTNFTGGGVIRLPLGDFAPIVPVNLTVQISPPEAIAAGARWRIVGSPTFRASGENVRQPLGPIEVEFKEIPGFAKPSTVSVTLVGGQDTSIPASYTPISNPNPPRITSITASGNIITLRARRITAGLADLEASSNLQTWTTLRTVDLPADTEAQFEITLPISTTTFFRLKNQ